MGDTGTSRVRCALTSHVSEVWYELVGLTCGWSGGVGGGGTLWRSAVVTGAATIRRRSTAEIREDESERLPFLSKRALKLSLLVDLLRATGRIGRVTGSVGVTGGVDEEEEDEIRCLSSSGPFLPSIFLFDLRQTEKDQSFLFANQRLLRNHKTKKIRENAGTDL